MSAAVQKIKAPKKKKMTWKQFKRFIPIYLFMLPGLIYLFVNNYMPLPGLVVAFKQYNAVKGRVREFFSVNSLL